MNEEIKTKIDNMVKENKVFLFMKGEKEMPMCGFSKHTVDILNHLNVEFETFNVLSDDEMRVSLKEYSQWPTFPQLYVKGELVGGCDIVTEMYQSGELEELFSK